MGWGTDLSICINIRILWQTSFSLIYICFYLTLFSLFYVSAYGSHFRPHAHFGMPSLLSNNLDHFVQFSALNSLKVGKRWFILKTSHQDIIAIKIKITRLVFFFWFHIHPTSFCIFSFNCWEWLVNILIMTSKYIDNSYLFPFIILRQ